MPQMPVLLLTMSTDEREKKRKADEINRAILLRDKMKHANNKYSIVAIKKEKKRKQKWKNQANGKVECAKKMQQPQMTPSWVHMVNGVGERVIDRICKIIQYDK